MSSIRKSFAIVTLALVVVFVVALPAQTSRAPATHPTPALLDLNTATPSELKSLPGIGDAYVRRIIAGRPYTAKNQLLTRGVLPQPAYDKIASRIIAKHPAR